MQVWSLNTVERFDSRHCWRQNVDLSPCPGMEAFNGEHAENWLATPLEVRLRLCSKHDCNACVLSAAAGHSLTLAEQWPSTAAHRFPLMEGGSKESGRDRHFDDMDYTEDRLSAVASSGGRQTVGAHLSKAGRTI